MSENLRVLVTGFSPFTGAPFNPTMALVRRLTQLRRPALDYIELTGHIFHVAYQTVDHELPGLIERLRPRVLLMFGLADRTPYLRVETRARNALTGRLSDADGKFSRNGSIVSDGPDALFFGAHTAKVLRAALATRIDARPSCNAGSYLCKLFELACDRGHRQAWRASPRDVHPCAIGRAQRLISPRTIGDHPRPAG